MDLYKDHHDLEQKLSHGGSESSRIRKEFYDLRMQRLHESKKRAKNEADLERFKKIERESEDGYRKYRGKSFRGISFNK